MQADNGTSLVSRVGSLERWRNAIDSERGAIMAELSGVREGLGDVVMRLGRIESMLSDINGKLEDRPSREEFKVAERDIKSLRAKAAMPKLNQMEIVGPGGFKMKLLGFNGFTVVLTLIVICVAIIAAVVALWLYRTSGSPEPQPPRPHASSERLQFAGSRVSDRETCEVLGDGVCRPLD